MLSSSTISSFAHRNIHNIRRTLAHMNIRHASVLTSLSSTFTPSSNSTTSTTRSKSASQPTGLVPPYGAAAAAERVLNAWPIEAQPAELRYILKASRKASEPSALMSLDARRARAARAQKMLDELEATLDASRQALNRLENRIQIAIRSEPREAEPQSLPIHIRSTSTKSATTISNHPLPKVNTPPATNTRAYSGSSHDHGSFDYPSDHLIQPDATEADARDRYITMMLMIISGLIGYIGYKQYCEPRGIFADKEQWSQPERLSILCGWQR
jgi:hypothetical protein